MPRPDYVRCETCVYHDGVHGKCRFHPYIGTDVASHGFCNHWRSTWPVEYREFITTENGITGPPVRVEVPPPEVPQ